MLRSSRRVHDLTLLSTRDERRTGGSSRRPQPKRRAGRRLPHAGRRAPGAERLIEDPFARPRGRRSGDRRGPCRRAAAERDPAAHPLHRRRRDQRSLAAHAGDRPQVLLLGAGLRRQGIPDDVDQSAPRRVLRGRLPGHARAQGRAARRPRAEGAGAPRCRSTSPSAIRRAAGRGRLRSARPTIVVWEGVINYLDAATAESVVEQIAAVLQPGGQLVADYVEMAWFKGSGFERRRRTISNNLARGRRTVAGRTARHPRHARSQRFRRARRRGHRGAAPALRPRPGARVSRPDGAGSERG